MKSGSNLERVLTEGHFAVTGELGPPKSANAEVVREKARILKGKVDAVNITDCQTAIVRMSSIGAGTIVQAEGVEPVIQMTCRDRNRIGMQADILGAAALGLKNLLCLTGDHQKFGNHPGAKGVFDMDSIQLLGMARGMRDERRFQCGEEIKSHEPRFFLGCAANPFAGPFEFRAARLAKKVQNGADFVQTQIIYNVEKFAKFMEMVRDLGLHERCYILAGITPPKSLGMARYMKNFVPGLDVTDEVIKRLQGAKDKRAEGIQIAVDLIQQVREIEGVAGVHVMAIEWEEAVPEIVERAGLLPRPFAEETPAAPVEEEAAEEAREAIEVTDMAAVKAEADEILAAAKREAEALIARAREEAAALRAAGPTTTEPATADTQDFDEAGED
ncbi:MAG TPA: methylenetetrahydrofolate reductase, partial [Desulfobacterales bacterium]|nr:methylenetetrahydrofolate reductase [Desulfobacterales bacterium]